MFQCLCSSDIDNVFYMLYMYKLLRVLAFFAMYFFMVRYVPLLKYCHSNGWIYILYCLLYTVVNNVQKKNNVTYSCLSR